MMNMSNRRNFNPNRVLADNPPRDKLVQLCERVSYEGSPFHKRNPQKFRLPSPPKPRSDKSLCDDADVSASEVVPLLKKGISLGLISQQQRNGFPKNVWAVSRGGIPLEAILTNETTGCYHGYPLLKDDRFGQQVLSAWEVRHA